MSDQNQYYPLITGPDGQVQQSTTPQAMPSAASVDKQQQQLAAQQIAQQKRASAPRNPAPNPPVTRAKGAIGIPFKRGK